ncbi:hypothetical protein AB0I00_30365 [Streptomyces sp. NPDC050803]|uniref:hypothetical protein n=1 Tax=unclassified Streptomyces TaxID=2593676 RepID=UPI00341EBAB0
MKNWREDGQPEWPEAASGTQAVPSSQGDTQAFAATGETAMPDIDGPAESEVPQESGEASERTDLNELLSAFDRFDRPETRKPSRTEPVFDETAVLPKSGDAGRPQASAAAEGRGAVPRKPGWPETRKPGRAEPVFDETAVLPKSGDAGRPQAAPAAEGRGAVPRKSGWPETRKPSRAEAFPATAPTPAPAPAPAPAPVPAPAPASVRDPWQDPEAEREPVGSAATHDPHEVTIQLDGIGLQLDGAIRAAKGGPGGGSDSSDGPVFVDESGRRSRRFRRLGIAVGIACAVYAVVIVTTLLSGNSNAPWLPVKSPKDEQPAGQVDTPPLPAESAPSTGTGEVSPGASPSASDGVTPSPGASATAPDASGTAEEPGVTTDPEPTATKTTTDPGTDPTWDPDPTDAPTTPTTDPTPTDEPTTPDPTETEGEGGSGGTGTDNVADGPSDPTPITDERPAEEPGSTASPYDPSPEYIL